MTGASGSAWRTLWAQQRLDSRETPLPLQFQRAGRSNETIERVQGRRRLRTACLDEVRQSVDRALLIERQQLELLLEHLLELRQAQTFIGLARLTDALEHPIASFVERTLGQPDINEGAQYGLFEAA